MKAEVFVVCLVWSIQMSLNKIPQSSQKWTSQKIHTNVDTYLKNERKAKEKNNKTKHEAHLRLYRPRMACQMLKFMEQHSKKKGGPKFLQIDMRY